jgi:hypothetical protein
MAFNATFNNISVISWQSVLLDEDTRVNIQYSSSVLKHVINMDEAMKLGQRQVFRAVPTNTEYTKTLYFKHCINIVFYHAEKLGLIHKGFKLIMKIIQLSLATGGCFLQILRFPPIKLTSTI